MYKRKIEPKQELYLNNFPIVIQIFVCGIEPKQELYLNHAVIAGIIIALFIEPKQELYLNMIDKNLFSTS